MRRRLAALAVLLSLGGCVAQAPRQCRPGYHAEQVRTDGVVGDLGCWRVERDAA